MSDVLTVNYSCGCSATGHNVPSYCPEHPSADVVCEHGTAMDVHCCNCHSGFLFDANSCVCVPAPSDPVEDGALRAGGMR